MKTLGTLLIACFVISCNSKTAPQVVNPPVPSPTPVVKEQNWASLRAKCSADILGSSNLDATLVQDFCTCVYDVVESKRTIKDHAANIPASLQGLAADGSVNHCEDAKSGILVDTFFPFIK